MEGRMEESVTIFLRNFVGEGIKKVIGRNCFILELRTWVTLYVLAT